MAFAVVQSGGKQYLVKKGDKVSLEKMNLNVGDEVNFKKVLLVSPDDQSAEVGTPFLETPVLGKVVEHGRGEKIRVMKKKGKKRYERTIGHRQSYTMVEITQIA